ncbi:MAG: DUF4190 domain-containing protein [Myxococcaceae bacterium]
MRPFPSDSPQTAPPPRTSRLAIWSLVSGALFFIPLFSTLAACILGGLALREIRTNPTESRGQAIAVGGIALGLLGIPLRWFLGELMRGMGSH